MNRGGTPLPLSLLSLSMAAIMLTLAAASATAACNDETRIRLNQVGFHAAAAKRAVVSAAADEPLAWVLRDAAGAARLTGSTRLFGDDPVSGEHVHLVDFSEFAGSGRGFRIESGCATNHRFDIGDDPWGALRFDALAYFYHNRSGIPIAEPFAGGEQWTRPAGHERDTATCRADTDRHGNEWPGCDYTLDLTGGWYDAGDHGKYVVNGGIAVWTLLNIHERERALGVEPSFRDGHASIPEAGNGVNDLLDEVRFELEFLLRMQAPDDAIAHVPVGVARNRPGVEFTRIDAAGMAHHKIADEEWTALPTAPHEDDERRVLYPVSTAATLNLAANAAQCARVWRGIDDPFAARCLEAAGSAYAAARRNPEVYFIADFSGSGMYGDRDLDDEFFWAAAELFVTTGETRYEDDLRASPHFASAPQGEPAWSRVAPLGAVSLALVPNALPARDREARRARLVATAERFARERRRSGYHIPFAGDDYRWGSNSTILNRAMLLALAYDFTGDTGLRDAVIDAMDYLLGRNPLDRSFVSGYGERPFEHPHHRHWAPSFDASMPPPPPGALSGGPNAGPPADEVAREIAGSCAPQTCWRDDARAYSLNEVAINWNAPLVWVATFMDSRDR